MLIAGDIYDRSRPNPVVTREVLKQLIKISNIKPVIIIPGNHDRSKLNIGLLYLNKNIHIFNKPENLLIKIKNKNVLITGTPFIGNPIKKYFEEENSLQNVRTTSNDNIDLRILMLHELVETSKFGIHEFEFKKYMNGVIPLNLIPESFDYVALGHVHTFQKIKNRLNMMYYSGSIERTSVVERNEEKGFIITAVYFIKNQQLGFIFTKFCKLPTRPLLFYKLNNISEFEPTKLEVDLLNNKKRNRLKPIVILRTKNSSNYSDYSNIKLHLRNLKNKSLILDFSIFSEDFRIKKLINPKILAD